MSSESYGACPVRLPGLFPSKLTRLWYTRIAHFASAMVLALACGTVGADIVEILPLDAQATTQDGETWTVDPASLLIVASRSGFSDSEGRGILEYSLAGIPEGAAILSATVEFEIALLSGPTRPVLEFHGYAGDGVLDAADATVPFNVIGQSSPISEIGAYTASLDATAIESLLGAGSHLGIMTYQQVENEAAGFWAIEASPLNPPATLTIEFDANPCPADFDGDGDVDSADLAELLLEWGLCFGRSAEELMLEPIDAQAVTEDGEIWTIDPSSLSINASRFSGIPLERRGVLEFALGGIPSGAAINSAVMQFRINRFTSPPSPVIEFHGYAGNGVLEAADALVDFNFIGESPAITRLGILQANLNPAYIESLRASSSHLGLMTYQQTVGTQAAFCSVEWPALSPTLVVEFLGNFCAADFDGDYDVDSADLAQVLVTWGPCE